jgi:DNA-binding CsgD family transcriptional regulator
MTQDENNRLSTREQSIIRLVARAKSRKTIADELNLSIHTVDTHLRHIHLKTNTHSLSELVVWAMRRPRELSRTDRGQYPHRAWRFVQGSLRAVDNAF